jgi:hypothetical protein
MQVGDVGFQHPRAGSPVVMILCQCLTNSFTLERFCRFTQVLLNNGHRRHFWRRQRHLRKSKMLRLKNHFIAAAGGSRQNYRPMNSMFQFAHVSRKTVVLQ